MDLKKQRKMKKTLPSIRISDNTISNINEAIKKHNQNNLVPLTIQQFRRLSYELLSQAILQNKIKELSFKFE